MTTPRALTAEVAALVGVSVAELRYGARTPVLRVARAILAQRLKSGGFSAKEIAAELCIPRANVARLLSQVPLICRALRALLPSLPEIP